MRRSSARAAGSRSAVARATPPSAPTPTGDRSLDRTRGIAARRSHAAARPRHDPLAGLPPFRADAEITHETHGALARDLAFPEHSGTHLDAPIHFHAPGSQRSSSTCPRSSAPRWSSTSRTRSTATPTSCSAPRTSSETRWRTERSAQATPSSSVRLGRVPRRPRSVPRRRRSLLPRAGARRRRTARRARRRRHRRRHARRRSWPAATFPAHRITLPAGVWHLEGLIGLDRLPARGSWLFVGVIPVVGGSGAPARVLAILPA